jgi:uncharacterized protein (TIGR00299 family) protein
MQTGASGDMILGALFDLGLDFPAWKETMGTLGIAGVALSRERVSKHGIMATHFRVEVPHEHVHRGLPEIRRIITASGVPARTKADAIAVFTRLAEAEARIHGTTIEQVHFHEVGALDAIVDIVGACLGFEMLGVSEFFTTPFTFGSGTVRTQHGTLAVPVPATLALTEGFPSRRTGLPGELCTPTGAAIISTFSKPLPGALIASVIRTGYGSGTRDIPEIANVLRICLLDIEKGKEKGRADGSPDPSGRARYPIFQLECNLDNMAPELIGYAAERLLASGCKDVWQEPIFMKKNRAAVKLCALVEAPGLDAALALFATETSTGGVRYFPVQRLVAERSSETVATRYGPVELKKTLFPGAAAPRYTPEFESCRKLAEAGAVPLQEIYREAMAQASRKSDGNVGEVNRCLHRP